MSTTIDQVVSTNGTASRNPSDQHVCLTARTARSASHGSDRIHAHPIDDPRLDGDRVLRLSSVFVLPLYSDVQLSHASRFGFGLGEVRVLPKFTSDAFH